LVWSVGRDTQYKGGVGRDTDKMFGIVGRVNQCKGGVGRDTDNVFGSVGRDTCCKDVVGRDTDNLSRAQVKGWIRSGNDRRDMSSNQTTARRTK